MPTTPQPTPVRNKPRKRVQPTPEVIGGSVADPESGKLVEIPLSRLVPSPINVRKTPSGSLDGLAASILSYGLLQNLNVTPEIGPDGQPSGHFQVIAGGRRLAALSKLAREKRLPHAFPVPCRVVPAGHAQESSLAENIVREAMHPADQFEAFRALADQGLGTEAIAARFGVTTVFVRQRLKLANVSPRLFERFRADEIGLDQLMALAITDDHAAQERVWNAAPEWRRTPQALRAALTESKVDADSDPRVRLVGLDAYLAAGGGVERDLFQEEHAGYLTDPGLLDRLMAEKLETVAAAVRAEGWGWVEVSPAYPPLHEYGRIYPVRVPLSPEAAAELAALESERDGLDERYNGEAEYPEEAATRLEEIESRIDEIHEGAQAYRPEEQALAGAIVALSGGDVAVYRGLVRKADRSKVEGVRAGDAAEPQATPDGEPEGQAGYSGALTESLTAQRTAAIRVALMERPDVALLALTHNLAVQTFYASYQAPSALEVAVKQDAAILVRHAEEVEPTRAGKALEEKRTHWAARLPRTAAELWGWLSGQEQTVILELLAHCVSQTVNAVQLPYQRPTEPRLEAAHRLAEALALDMADWWRPTAANFFRRVKREKAIEAVVEATGAKDAIALGKLKKSELAAEAEKRLADRRWLPTILKS